MLTHERTVTLHLDTDTWEGYLIVQPGTPDWEVADALAEAATQGFEVMWPEEFGWDDEWPEPQPDGTAKYYLRRMAEDWAEDELWL